MDLDMGSEIINQGSLFSSKVKWNGLGNVGSYGIGFFRRNIPSYH